MQFRFSNFRTQFLEHCHKNYRPKAWREMLWAACPTLFFWGIYLLLPHLGYLYTWTGSLPIGIWRYNQQGTRSHYVLFCLADNTYSRFYRNQIMLPDDKGPYSCANNTMRLMKPILAREGDQIDLTSGSVNINGIPLPLSATEQRAHKTHALIPHIPRGHYRVKPGTVWVFSTYNGASYDSRYYGPIDIHQIISGVEPVFVYTDNPNYQLVTSGSIHCLWHFCWISYNKA